MENKAHAMAAGIFVVVVTALLVALGVWLGRDKGDHDLYEISTRESVSGLQLQADVRYRGVEVGKVEAIGFDPAVQGQVLVRLSVDRQVPVTRGTFASLGFQGVTGLAYIQLDDDGTPGPRLPADPAHPPRIPLKPGLIGNLMTQGSAILEKVNTVGDRVNQLLADDNQRRIAELLDRMNQAAGSVTQLATRLDSTLKQRVDPALAVVPGLADETAQTLRALRGTADEVTRTAGELGQTARRLNQKDGPVDRLAEGAQALSHAADTFNSATLPRLNRVSEEASRAALQLSRTVNAINDNPQSLIFGNGAARPGPGESGFTAPPAAPSAANGATP